MDKLQTIYIDNINLELSRKFVRGHRFDIIMHLPKHIPAYYFNHSWRPKAQLRKLNNPTPDGFIADLNVGWWNEECTTLGLSYDDTSDWPLGPVEFDVVLTNSVGYKVRTLPVRFTIVPGVTQ